MVDVNELEMEALEAAALRNAGAAGNDDDDDPTAAVAVDPFDDVNDGVDEDFISDDGDGLPDEVLAELEALASTEFDDGTVALESALAEAQRELAQQRNLTRQAIERYRDALLAAEPELPPDLVSGDTLEEVEASALSARDAVARIRERVATERTAGAERPRGFPVGAPARSTERGHAHSTMSAHEKIAAGLQERLI